MRGLRLGLGLGAKGSGGSSPLSGIMDRFGRVIVDRFGSALQIRLIGDPDALRLRDASPVSDRSAAEILVLEQGAVIPPNALRQRDDAVISNRAGNYMEFI